MRNKVMLEKIKTNKTEEHQNIIISTQQTNDSAIVPEQYTAIY